MTSASTIRSVVTASNARRIELRELGADRGGHGRDARGAGQYRGPAVSGTAQQGDTLTDEQRQLVGQPHELRVRLGGLQQLRSELREDQQRYGKHLYARQQRTWATRSDSRRDGEQREWIEFCEFGADGGGHECGV